MPDLTGITYGAGTFVAVGYDGTVLTSPDGINWIARNSGTTDTLGCVAFGNGTFVAVSHYTALTSPDGINWTARDLGFGDPSPCWGFCGPVFNSIVYGNGIFVTVGCYWFTFSQSAIIGTSSDGINWTINWSSGFRVHNFIGITYGNGTFLTVGTDGAILTSPDGINWTERNSGTTDILTGVAFGNGTFVAVGGGHYDLHEAWIDDSMILTSSDGVTWTQRKLNPDQFNDNFWGVAYGNQAFVTVGVGQEAGAILTSPDSISWTVRYTGTVPLVDITYGNGTFVAVGQNGTILQSAPFTSPPPLITPVIKANGFDVLNLPVTVFTDDVLWINVSLAYNGTATMNADWWVAAYAPFGWYSFTLDNGWIPGLVPSYQGPLFDLNPYNVLTITGLPEGDYVFYFGVDTNMNGVLDLDKLYYGYVPVTIKKR